MKRTNLILALGFGKGIVPEWESAVYRNFGQIAIRFLPDTMTQKIEAPIKLLLLIPHLGGGGAERITSMLARHLNPTRFEIHLVAITPDCPGAEPPPIWVTLQRLQKRRVRHAAQRLVRLIRKLHPDAILCNMAHLNFLLLALKPFLPRETRILVRQDKPPTSANHARFSRLCYRWLYPTADAILCQSESMLLEFANSFPIPQHKLVALANPVDIHEIRASQHASGDHGYPSRVWAHSSWPRLLSVGRLAEAKGYDLLLRAIPAIQKRFPKTQVAILGTGPEIDALRQLSRELNISQALHLPGYVSEVSQWYRQATLFVLPSRTEGMPNALLEAAAAGLPLVSTPCSGGVADLLQDSPGSWLAEDVSSLAITVAILEALAQLDIPGTVPLRFEHAFLAPYAAETAVAAYASVIERVVSQGKP